MKDFEIKENKIKCRLCGSYDISIKSGLMTDRITCNHCGNEEYT